jgi:hypothetical protein
MTDPTTVQMTEPPLNQTVEPVPATHVPATHVPATHVPATHVHLTPAQKLQVCLFKDENVTISQKKLIEFCQLNFQQTPSTSAMQRILHGKERWADAVRQNSNMKKYRGAKHPQLETVLTEWWHNTAAGQVHLPI